MEVRSAVTRAKGFDSPPPTIYNTPTTCYWGVMCDACEWEVFVEESDSLLELLEEIEDHAPTDFVEGIREKTQNMKEWVEENEHVTQKMKASVGNMQAGAGRWLR